jgi:metal-responsive CopG/Arc/MetJ family transcriptional regulator
MEDNMNNISASKSNRVSLTVPYSILEKVDAHVAKKLEDGESRETANRSAFIMEIFRLGLRVHENKNSKGVTDKTLDQKLELIAKNVIINGFVTDAIFSIQKETVDRDKVINNVMVLDPDWSRAVNERVIGKLQEYFK